MNPQETLREQIVMETVAHGKTSAEVSLSTIVFYEK